MPRAPRVIAPGGTMHVVARCNNREFYYTSAEDFELLFAHLREMCRTYEVTVYAYVPRRGRRRIGTMPSQNQEVRPQMVSGTFFNADVSKSPTRRLDVSICTSNMDTYLEYVQIVDTLPGEQLIQSHVQIKILLAHLLVLEHPHVL
jgi:hypothetical protein